MDSDLTILTATQLASAIADGLCSARQATVVLAEGSGEGTTLRTGTGRQRPTARPEKTLPKIGARARCWTAAILTYCSLAAVGAETSADVGADSQYSNPSLRRAVQMYGEGSLLEAWRAFAQFIEHADGEKHYAEFLACQSDLHCPALGSLGYITGKSLPLSAIRLFCENVAPADQVSQCRYFLEADAEYFPAGTVDHEIRVQQLPLNHLPVAYEGLHRRPVVAVVVNGKAYMAVVDTGNSRTWISFEGDGITKLSERERQMPGLEATRFYRYSLVRVDSFQIGKMRYSPKNLLRVYVDSTSIFGKTPVWVGMDFLLRHGAVCFDWESRTLHLDELGPCADGAVAHHTTLTKQLGLELTVRTRTGKMARGVVDTGAGYTYCSIELANAGPGWKFSFGDHDTLRMGCRHDELILGVPVIGMDTLGEFRAFGWQLNPLRTYFVPDDDAFGGD